MIRTSLAFVFLAAGLVACDAVQAPPAETPAADTQAAAPAPPAVPSGPAATVEALAGDHPEAYVTDVVALKSDAKLYSTAGGDPAINGLYTYIARHGDPELGWRVFQIGDFNSWELVEDRGAEVVLKVSRSWVDDNGEIKSAEERYIVSVPNEAATSITVTPAS